VIITDALIIPVTYRQPSYDELRTRYDSVFRGYETARFEPIDLCKHVAPDPCELEFKCVRPAAAGTGAEQVVSALTERGLRPALYEEFLCFDEKAPQFHERLPLVALGSDYSFEGSVCSPCVYRPRFERRLDFTWVKDDCYALCQFLAVRTR
jgi:hypothetical protein